MHECVKCGADIPIGAKKCFACTWPFSHEAWRQSALHIRRVTLDTSCVNAKRKDEALNTLERWAEEGGLDLQRSDAMLDELQGETRIEKAISFGEHPSL